MPCAVAIPLRTDNRCRLRKGVGSPSQGGASDEVALTVMKHYPFTKIQSWTNEGMYVVLETLNAEMEVDILHRCLLPS